MTVMVPACTSISSTPRMRSSDSTTSPPSGVAAPASPVSPPCGTTGWHSRWHSASTAATSSVLRGRTTASGGTGPSGAYQSLRKRVSMASPVSRPAASSSAASSVSRAEDGVVWGAGLAMCCACEGEGCLCYGRMGAEIRANRAGDDGTIAAIGSRPCGLRPP